MSAKFMMDIEIN